MKLSDEQFENLMKSPAGVELNRLLAMFRAGEITFQELQAMALEKTGLTLYASGTHPPLTP